MHAKKTFFRKFLGIFIALATVLLGLAISPVSPARAAGTGSLTIVSSGGSAENSGWTYVGGVIELTQAVTWIDASILESKWDSANLTIDVENITFAATISATVSRSLNVKSAGNIRVLEGVSILSNGADVTLQSDSDSSGAGAIWLGSAYVSGGGTISTGGGDLILGGGANVSTGRASVSSGYLNPAGSPTNTYPAKPEAGVAVYGFTLNAGGGDVLVRGGGTAGSSVSSRAIIFENSIQNSVATAATVTTNGNGTIVVDGDGSSLGSNPWGVVLGTTSFSSVRGNISIFGKANTGRGNARGWVISNTTIESVTGDVALTDTTDGAPLNYSGSYLGGTTTTISTNGNIALKADEYISDGTLKLVGPSAVIEPYTGNSFTESRNLGLVNAAECAEFRFGKAGNETELKINQPITFGSGSLSSDAYFYGGKVTFTGAITASRRVSVSATAAVTQTAKITATSLELSGTGPFTLAHADNNVATIAGGSAASRLGNVTYKDKADGLVIGTVGSTSGIYSSGVINIETTAGNLNIEQPVDSSAASGDSVLLYASKGTASGSAGNGNVILSGSGALATSASARALIYSGSSPLSTGLASAVGGEENARAEYDATTSLASLSLGANGKFAIFRITSPVYRVTFDSNGSTSGTAPAYIDSSGSLLVATNSGSLAKTGFTFVGWNSQADGLGTAYAVGSSITPTSNTTLFAAWTASSAPPSGGSSYTPPTPARVQGLEIKPGTKSTNSILKVRLADLPQNAIPVQVKVRLFDFNGKLIETITVPVLQNSETLEIDLSRPLGEYNVDASAITATAVTDAISASPFIVKKINYLLSTNGKKLTLLGKASGTAVYFAANSSKLTDEAKSSLAGLAKQIKESNSRVAVTGFVSQWTKGKKLETRLAEQRAQVAARYLKAQGVSNWVYFAGYGVLNKKRSEPTDRKVEIRLFD